MVGVQRQARQDLVFSAHTVYLWRANKPVIIIQPKASGESVKESCEGRKKRGGRHTEIGGARSSSKYFKGAV